ncbi:TIGR03619 family F420-dependent LLM class oxidoreductase [Actinocatenispora rupis]|uniref:LLM class F420-dependent oxidoreductase n=1 Tax=Actinocatenispora rupis TaxID=519421 RepID=A0A8J3NDR6_9ACTN|nr:TIGR03619 family F420-dependent LLM class oxidoreductase [Actinocatenispora rupis]GID15306.1 LLM class F420-dependent oxidoreductase [Actinocatenispora rupis]
MRIGLSLPQYGPLCRAADVASFAREAEAMGYGSFWVGDRILTPVEPSDIYPGFTPEHPYPPEFTAFLDPLVVLSAAATVTTTARLGTSTLNAPWHSPLLLGRTLTSLDQLSGGRLDVGLGIGWMRDEYSSTNTSWERRGALLDEMLDALTAMWTSDPVEHDGVTWRIPPSRLDLRPAQRPHPPVLLGGTGPAALRRVGRRAAGWLAVPVPTAVLGPMWDTIRAAADDAGRDPDTIRRELRINPPAGTELVDVARQVADARTAGMDGAFVDLHYLAEDPAHALDLASQLWKLLEDS